MTDIQLTPLPDNLPNVVRRIRACEGEIAAQVVFECALNEYARAAIEAHEARKVPDGWQLVPIEPTLEMVGAWKTVEQQAATKVLYRTMLASAPPAPQAEPAPAGSGGWEAHANAMERELAYWKQRAQTMHEHQKGDCWYWQGDGDDHPESMVNSLPVVIRADALRALMAPQASVTESVREPLTEDQIREAVRSVGMMFTMPDIKVARAIEAAHGITKDTP